ncbi:hypothetical protein HIM_05106 [Hirsutella minnesotensis 3608]|uniref:Uncharacterized protein n=1 Tax=Hirsutella minnesotensis 3608 TaxID=1043627 RepID=A0A0F7ZPF5_9HYPO|nr:hypothetical protein HIM_05106 [Hirsutella minnesotensis 3608]
MNRLRGKKKNRDEVFPPRPSMETESSGPFRMFGKKKIQEEEEPKKEIDISAALPTTDDFRTSLLMTGLSARFSMLREQDDPKSKIGKASDDSVLMPKRQSRLMDFGTGPPLHDIAEIESLKARHFPRVESYVSSDDAASTAGSSVMNRGKPVEGNNLFGGRQKIYKIPAGASSRPGGMGGRALYDDDVAQSAFQKWRQAEKERQSLEQDRQESDAGLDYDYRRETASTISSSPSATRDSTAATSITSQPSVKERQPTPAAQQSQQSTAERNVPRTRRLYEQGLTQDLQDQQSSAVFRMDNLSRQRPFGSRTPDLISPVSPPVGSSIHDRIGERRTLVSKASAPNLRSLSPPTSALPPPPMLSPPDLNSKFPHLETKPTYGGNPPLSPPISEAEDYSILPIQPNDKGKATAMGVFQRPQQYDDSKYAQRQRQLQQGRETPTSQSQPFAEPNAGNESIRSHSSLSHGARRDKTSPSMVASTGARKDNNSPTFFDDSDDAFMDNHWSLPSITPQLTIERPDDQDHPAFRKSALPTPLSICSSKMSDEMPPLKEKPGESSPEPQFDASPDSPTLGPTATTGLSGMVRQHLRTDSGASSISALTDHDVMPDSSRSASKSAPESALSKVMTSHEAPASPDETSPRDKDFARHLADGARRVRERLTTYVESDSDRSSATTPSMEPTREFHPFRANGLGILRSKSSRSSFQESDAQEPSRAKSLKEPASSFNGAGPLAPLQNPSVIMAQTKIGRQGTVERQGSNGSQPSSKDEQPQPGLKAFRQARREMQKMREMELQQRHHVMPRLAGMFDRTVANPSPHEAGPPPAMFNRVARDDSRHSSRSSANSHAASEPRDRSGSEASTGSQIHRAGGRLRIDSVARDELQHQPSPTLGSAGFSAPDAPWSPPKPPPMPLSAGVSPSHSTGAVDRSGRRPDMSRDVSDKSGSPTSQRSYRQHETSPYSRSRNGPGLGSAVSTPNLRAAAASSPAPPVPPINPRRREGFGGFSRPSIHSTHTAGSHGHYDGPHDVFSPGLISDEEGSAGRYPHGVRRVISDNDERGHLSPERSTFRSPKGRQLNMAHGELPGGMI